MEQTNTSIRDLCVDFVVVDYDENLLLNTQFACLP
jgi:hypothetical protein